ncbi:MAG: molybdenum cofactor guanylyltransferase [Acidimicrobiales bacterium]|nr:molybdenum cofactor guanylyltransferase [Acidimicrobiales bacterium]
MSDPAAARGRDLVGAVLVGGAGRRMGGPKALLEVDGRPMAAHVVRALHAAGCATVVAVGARPGEAEALGVAGLPDDRPGEGPLAALATVLGSIPPEDRARTTVVVAPCDVPDLSGAHLAALVTGLAAAPPDIAVAVPGPPRQPLPAAWRAAAADVVDALVVAGQRRADAAFGSVGVVEVALPAAATADVDAPCDLDRRRMGDP